MTNDIQRQCQEGRSLTSKIIGLFLLTPAAILAITGWWWILTEVY